MIEPGRSLVGNAGVLLTEVLYLKPGEQKNFCIVDAAMNDLPRPAMYQAFHGHRALPAQTYDVVALRKRRLDARPHRCTTWWARCANRATGWAATAALAVQPATPSAGRAVGRAPTHGHGQQLQHPPARGRGAGAQSCFPARIQ
jgi:hypothetical protein